MKQNISSERASELLRVGHPLIDMRVEGELNLETNEHWDKQIIFSNCVIEYFTAIITYFEEPVRFSNCHFRKCQFTFSYFLGGLTIDNCTFDKYLDFQAGGHNKPGYPVIITNNIFKDFVNFFDCWYEGEVTITNNAFQKGTNLLGRPNNIPVTFDVKPVIKDNVGQLDSDNEGE